MQVLFNLSFNIITGTDAKTANPFVRKKSERVIVSLDTLAGERVFARLREKVVEPHDLNRLRRGPLMSTVSENVLTDVNVQRFGTRGVGSGRPVD